MASDDRKWAWDTWHNRPVYIGDKEDWNLEETRERRDTGLNNPVFPWGGVWKRSTSRFSGDVPYGDDESPRSQT